MEEIELIPGVRITSHQCLWMPEDATIVVADLHIGYESALEHNGVHIPRIQTDAVENTLNEIIDTYCPDRMIIAGDIKHEFSRNLSQEFKDVRRIVDGLLDHTEVILVKGNHDNYLENIVSRIEVPVVDKFVQKDITIVHGHSGCDDRPLIMGHEHPSIKLVDKVGAYLKLPCFMHLKKEGIIVLPAFSPLASGTDLSAVSNEFLSPILRRSNAESAEIYACTDIGILPLGALSGLEGLRL
ncbi:MAG: metallophosphoesterase [Euryarchaeota archaeon]|nr:metallophosphoesterase [Euryarchaeota archaeon]